jgi:hypothetical protein
VALSRAIQALPMPLQHFYGLYQSHGLSCEILPTILQNIYFTAHIVQKNFLKAMRGLLEAMRVLLEAVIVLLEAVIVFLEAVRVLVEAIRVLVWPVRVPAEALRLLQRHESVCRGPSDVNKIETKAQTFRYRS